MRRDVADRRGRVPLHEELVGDVDEAQGAEDDQEQIPEPGHPPWVLGCPHVDPTHHAGGSLIRKETGPTPPRHTSPVNPPGLPFDSVVKEPTPPAEEPTSPRPTLSQRRQSPVPAPQSPFRIGK